MAGARRWVTVGRGPQCPWGQGGTATAAAGVGAGRWGQLGAGADH